MKSQLQNPSAGKAHYSTEYKQEAFEHWKNSGRSAAHVDQLQAEIRRVTAENAKLLEQREVLKKSLGILSEAPPSGMPKSKP